MISGYAGLRISDSGLTFTPYCPESSTLIRLRSVYYLSAQFSIEYSCSTRPEKLTVKMVAGSDRHVTQQPVKFFHGKKMLKTLEIGSEVTINLKDLPGRPSFLIV